MQPHLHPHGKSDWNLLHVDQDMDHWLAARGHDADEAFPDPVLMDIGDH